MKIYNTDCKIIKISKEERLIIAMTEGDKFFFLEKQHSMFEVYPCAFYTFINSTSFKTGVQFKWNGHPAQFRKTLIGPEQAEIISNFTEKAYDDKKNNWQYFSFIFVFRFFSVWFAGVDQCIRLMQYENVRNNKLTLYFSTFISRPNIE